MAAKTLSAADGKVQAYDPIWSEIRREATSAMASEPALGSFIFRDGAQPRPARGRDLPPAGAAPRSFRGRSRPDQSDVPGGARKAPRARAASSAPISPPCSIATRPATATSTRCSTSKASTRLATHRFANALWHDGRRDFALFLQSQSSRTFGVDIHPAAKFGQGIMIDHATGIVIGETARGRQQLLVPARRHARRQRQGDRRPASEDRRERADRRGRQGARQHHGGRRLARRRGQRRARRPCPAHVTVAGVPAKIVGSAGSAEPALEMEQTWVDDFGGL